MVQMGQVMVLPGPLMVISVERRNDVVSDFNPV